MFKFWKKKEAAEKIERPERIERPIPWVKNLTIAEMETIQFQQGPPMPIRVNFTEDGATFDSVETYTEDVNGIKQQFSFSGTNTLPTALVNWYGNQSFIQYQTCGILAQHWLIDKACTMPARDAIRKGYEITVNDGTEVGPEILDALRKYDEDCNINKQMLDFIRFGNIFGIRIAIFQVDSPDPHYYVKPFNIDGVTPDSYKGILQRDPMWITPLLDNSAAADPNSQDFYEPTWWQISGKVYHRSHLVIFRPSEVIDVLKPTYFYGGVPLPQKIWERVYNAERTANEGPMLAMTKRTNILKMDTSKAVAKQPQFMQKLMNRVLLRDNYGINVIDTDEEMQEIDTSLADLDEVIMTQYQIVAAGSEVPGTKLLGTQPKGFNSTGEYEEASYHERLESIQTHDLTRFLKRHHENAIRSYICPKFGIAPFEVKVVWKSLDSLTAKEQAEINKIKADTDAVHVINNALDAEDVRKRLIADPDSGYTGIDAELPEVEEPFMNNEGNQEEEFIEQKEEV